MVFLEKKIFLVYQRTARHFAEGFLKSMLAPIVLGLILLTPFSHADQPAEEYAVKAAYLYNFAKFVQWPAETFTNKESPINLCIIGDNPFGQALDAILGKTIRDRRLTVRELPYHQALADKDCNILFISQSEKENLDKLLATVSYTPVLTVSDIRGFADAGGMIGLIKIGQRIRFEINVLTVQQANLEISSQLLKLARIIDN